MPDSSDIDADVLARILTPPAARRPSRRSAARTGTRSEKIDKAARNFESLLVGHWLEQAEKSFASVPGTDPGPAGRFQPRSVHEHCV